MLHQFRENGFQDRGLGEGTGKSVERVMGTVNLPRREFTEGRYVPYADSVEIAKRHQPWNDPTMPSPVFARKLRDAILVSMPKLPPEFHKNLRFYTSVGSPLDQYHGIDAFIEFGIAGKEPVRITLDITMLPGKEAWKADILFSTGAVDVERFAGDISAGKFDGLIERVAKAAALLIFNKLAEKPIEKVFIPEKEESNHGNI